MILEELLAAIDKVAQLNVDLTIYHTNAQYSSTKYGTNCTNDKEAIKI